MILQPLGSFVLTIVVIISFIQAGVYIDNPTLFLIYVVGGTFSLILLTIIISVREKSRWM